MTTHETPQPHMTPDEAAAQVRDFVRNVNGREAAESAVELVIRRAPELREWAAAVLTRRGYTAAAARLRRADLPPLVERVNAAREIALQNAPNALATTDTGAPIARIPLDVELARLMVALDLPPAVALTYWAARHAVSENAAAGGRIALDELRTHLHRIGLHPAARTLDSWVKRGEGVLWRSHGRGRRRALYIRGHRRLCAHFTRRAARERPAAVLTNLPGKLWAELEFDGRRLDTAAILGKLWAAWYFTRERTHRISHATQRDLWNRTRLQLDEARRAAGVTPGRPGRIFHTHELAPARAYPAVFAHHTGERVVIPMTHAANAYTTRAAILAHRRARKSNHTAYAVAADVLENLTPYAPAIERATGQPGRVQESRVYFEHGTTSENFKRATRAIARERTDTARARLDEHSLARSGARADYFEQFTVSDDGSAPVSLLPVPVRINGKVQGGRLKKAHEDAHHAVTGGLAAWRAAYAAPHGESIPRRHKRGS